MKFLVDPQIDLSNFFILEKLSFLFFSFLFFFFRHEDEDRYIGLRVYMYFLHINTHALHLMVHTTIVVFGVLEIIREDLNT